MFGVKFMDKRSTWRSRQNQNPGMGGGSVLRDPNPKKKSELKMGIGEGEGITRPNLAELRCSSLQTTILVISLDGSGSGPTLLGALLDDPHGVPVASAGLAPGRKFELGVHKIAWEDHWLESHEKGFDVSTACEKLPISCGGPMFPLPCWCDG